MSDLEQYLDVRNSFDRKREYPGEGPGKYSHKTALSGGVYEGPTTGEGIINLDSAEESVEYAFNEVNGYILMYTSHTLDEIDDMLTD